LKRHLEKLNQSINDFKKRLVNPRRKIQELWLRADDFSSRLARLAALYVRRDKERLCGLTRRMNSNSPRALVQKINSKLDVNKYNLATNIAIIIRGKRATAGESTIRLESLNPLAILRRGYSVTRSLPDRRVVSHPGQVSLDQQVEILLADGQLVCNVKGKTHHGQEVV
jgi:exodeoxyribonuclease VII large subunit